MAIDGVRPPGALLLVETNSTVRRIHDDGCGRRVLFGQTVADLEECGQWRTPVLGYLRPPGEES
jgi:hypothetical protein